MRDWIRKLGAGAAVGLGAALAGALRRRGGSAAPRGGGGDGSGAGTTAAEDYGSPLERSPDFRALFEATPTPYLVVVPPAFTIVAVNDAYLRATHRRRDEVIGRALFDAFPSDPDDPGSTGVKNLRASLERVMKTGRADVMAVQKYSIPVRAGDGDGFEERWWIPLNTPVMATDGTVARIIHRVEDVTAAYRPGAEVEPSALIRAQQAAIRQLREANEALEHEAAERRRAETLLRSVLDSSRDVAYRRNLLTDAYDYLSPATRHVLGLEPERLEVMSVATVTERVHPEDRAGVREAIEAGLEEGGGAIAYRFRGDDDEYRWVEDRFTIQHDEAGRPASRTGVVRDITPQKRAEQAREIALTRAESAERHLRTIFEEAPVVIATYEGPEHVVRVQNQAHRDLFGGRTAVGMPAREAMPELEAQGYIELLDRVYRTGERFVGREVAARIDVGDPGRLQERFFDFVNEPLGDPAGTITGVLSVAVDVTESVLARRAAEVASNAKSQFLAVMSHEIRTPLNAVLGYTELLREGVVGEPTPPQRKYLDRIVASGSHLMTLITDVLDLAKIESGELKVRAERVLLRPVIQQALSVAEPLVRKKGLSLESEAAPELGLEVWGDENRIRQVLVNLLSNASKFTEQGEVRLRRMVRMDRPDGLDAIHEGPWVGIAVEDTGIGIASHRLNDIFEPFVQAEDDVYTRTHEGTGLGLGISRRLAWMMGGDLTVDSREGRGSTFVLWLPGATADDAGPPDRRRQEDRRSSGDRRRRDRRGTRRRRATGPRMPAP